VVGFLLAIAMALIVAFLSAVLDQSGVSPGKDVFDLVQITVLGLGLFLPQYAVMRVVLGYDSAAVRAWVPVSLVVWCVDYFVSTYWVRNAPPGVTIPIDLAEGVVLGLGQGFLLSEILHSRPAPWLWLVGLVLFFAESFALPSDLLAGANVWVQAIVGGSLFGGLYGASTGAVLWFLVRRSARRLPSPTEAAINAF
jgi:hypothetical protein